MKKTLLSMMGMSVVAAAMATSFTFEPMPLKDGIKCDLTKPELQIGTSATQMAATRAEAEKSMDYTIGYQPYTATTLGQNAVGLNVLQFIRLSADVATEFAGATVKSINFYNPCTITAQGTAGANSITSATVYLCSSLGNRPETIWEKGVELGTQQFGYNSIALDEPYVLEAGKELYAGFAVNVTSSKQYYLTVDAMPTNNPDGCIIGVNQGSEYQWLSGYNTAYGCLCISVTLVGDNLPEDGVEIYDVVGPSSGFIDNQKLTVLLYVTPDSATPVQSMEVEYTVPGAQTVTVPLGLQQPIGYHDLVAGELDINVTEFGDNVIPFTVTKVNDKPNTSKNNSFTYYYVAQEKDKGYEHKFVIEEGTGTWCGWCPAGMEFLDWVKRKFPDVLLTAVHVDDEMQVESAEELFSLFPSFPSLYVNRAQSYSPSADSNARKDFLNYYETQQKLPSYAEVFDVSAVTPQDGKLEISGKARFAYDLNNINASRYGISYEIVENGVGPYMQQNFYSGSSTQMGDWNGKPEVVRTIYDDVLTQLDGGINGFGIFPEDIKADEEYPFDYTLDLSNVMSEDYIVHVILTDNISGEIIGASDVHICPVSVEDINADRAQVIAESWLDLNGVKSVAPATGVNIKRTQLSDGTVRYSKVVISK